MMNEMLMHVLPLPTSAPVRSTRWDTPYAREENSTQDRHAYASRVKVEIESSVLQDTGATKVTDEARKSEVYVGSGADVQNSPVSVVEIPILPTTAASLSIYTGRDSALLQDYPSTCEATFENDLALIEEGWFDSQREQQESSAKAVCFAQIPS